MYKLQWDKVALKQFRKLAKSDQTKIREYLERNVKDSENPRIFGKALSGNLRGLWRYRVGNFRVVCKIEDKQIIVTVVGVSHRSNIYKILESMQ